MALTLVGSFTMAAFGLMAVLAGMKEGGTEAMLATVAGVLMMLPFVQTIFALKGKHLGNVALVVETVFTGGLGIVFILIRHSNAQYEKANATAVFQAGKNGDFFQKVAY